jgi:protoporphyrin/coproporphyrin ferrochelatase
MPPRHTAVLLMAYGSPNRLEDVEPYFTDIRGGRTPSREAIEELTSRYRRVGVPTPLIAVSMALGRELERLLNLNPPDEEIYTVHLGMKHWTPHIASAVEEILESGADRMIAIVLAPHYSKISTEGYRRKIEAALAAPKGKPTANGSASPVDLDFVESWYELDGYLDAVADNVRHARAEFAHPEDVVAVFTAHSLPARILNEGDPYQDQLLRTSELVAQRANIKQWRFSYQSQSQTGEPWLGPDLVDTVETLAAQGHRAILVASVGFIADHLEIFYDIDIEAKEKADALGIELRRTPMLNADPRLAQALHALVAQRSPHPALPQRRKEGE